MFSDKWSLLWPIHQKQCETWDFNCNMGFYINKESRSGNTIYVYVCLKRSVRTSFLKCIIYKICIFPPTQHKCFIPLTSTHRMRMWLLNKYVTVALSVFCTRPSTLESILASTGCQVCFGDIRWVSKYRCRNWARIEAIQAVALWTSTKILFPSFVFTEK